MSGSEDIEDIRERKLQEMRDKVQQQQQQQGESPQSSADPDEKRDAILKQILTEDARQRLKTVRLAHEDRAEAVESKLIMLAQQQRLSDKVTDEQLKQILSDIAESESTDFNINRR